MDRTYKQRRSFKEEQNTYIYNQKKILLKRIMRKVGLENLALTGYIKGKGNRVTYFTRLTEWMTEQGEKEIVKIKLNKSEVYDDKYNKE